MKTLKILFTEEEQKEIEIFSEKIDLENTLKIVQYGILAQKKVADLSGDILEIAQNGEEDLKNKVVEKLEQVETKISKEELMKRLEKLAIELDRMMDELLLIQKDLIKQFLLLDRFSQKNKSCYKELLMYILAGERKIEKEQADQCEQLKKRLQDLELSKVICTQMEAQLVLLKENYKKFSEEIQCELDQTIPLLKNRITMLLEGIS